MSIDNDPYDPNAPEGDVRRGSQYMSRKDIKILAGLVVLLVILLYPVYQTGVRNSEKVRCIGNMKAMYDAMAQYADQHDGRFPPVYRTGVGLEPGLGDSGRPYTWASDIQGYMNTRASFVCPSAKKNEVVPSEDSTKLAKILPTTYGMYAPYGGYLQNLIDNPDQTIILAETSNLGSQTSYDPIKFDGGGKELSDGFEIGWSDSNEEGSASSLSVTRLAFRKTSTGDFKSGDAAGRHDAGIHVVTASGERRILTPAMAQILLRDKLPSGMWTIPPIVHRK